MIFSITGAGGFALPAKGALLPHTATLTITPDRSEIDPATGSVDVIYTLKVTPPAGQHIGVFSFDLKAPAGMTLSKTFTDTRDGDGYWLNSSLSYHPTFNKTGIFETFSYTPEPKGYFIGSGTTPQRNMTTEADIMTIKATITDASKAGSYALTAANPNVGPDGTDTFTFDIISNPVIVKASAVTPVANEPVTATAVTVGQTLASSILSGSFKVSSTDSTAVTGTLAWTDSTTVVNATGNFGWTFTPTDTDTYNVVTGTVNVVANPIEKVTPVEDEPVTATAVTVGQTLASSILSGSFKVSSTDSTTVTGTLAWTDSATVVNATGNFGWTFTPTDTDTYNVVTGTVNVVANPPTPASWEATGGVGIHEGKVYTGYQLMDETEPVSLTGENIDSITVSNPDSTTATLTPDTDPLLWFNVEKAEGDYVYTIVTKGGITYSATLTWSAPFSAAWEATGAEGVAPHNKYLYREYQLKHGGNPISLAATDVTLIAQKGADGNWGALTPNTDSTLWFDRAKPTGNYEHLIVNASGIYQATLAWIESPVPVSSITVTSASDATTMLHNPQGGSLQMSASVLPANATNQDVTWTVTPKGPAWSEVGPGEIGAGSAQITNAGLLNNGVTLGPVTVRATAKDGSGIYDEIDITVSGVKMSYGGASIIVDETYQLTALAVPNNTTDFTWESSDTTVATVSSTGLVTAIKVGTANITATTEDGRVGSCSIGVQPKPLATIMNLTISEGTLTPDFHPDIYDFTATVANSVKSVTIDVVEWGSMVASGDIGTFDLSVGKNTFEINVTGADYTDATYTVVITRKSASSGGGGGGGGAVTPTVAGIEIKSAPDKLVYTEGDTLDLTGLEVTLTYSNGNKKYAALNEFDENDITVSPKDGDVLDAADTEIVITVNGKSVKQAITVNKKETVTPPPVEKPVLNDIDGHWAQANIEYLVGIGAVAGYPDETFRPDALITRAEFAKVIVDAFELTAESGKVFTDTAEHWAKDYIAIAAANGIVLGYNDTEFGPDDLITREQMAIMIVKAAGLKDVEGELAFSDKDDVSSWAYNWVVSATQNKIMSGYTDNTFKPLINATRAEAATVIYNVLMK